MASNIRTIPEGLARLELSQLLAFNSQIAKLVAAGVPIRFPGAPVSVADWLDGMNKRVALSAEQGNSAGVAIGSDPAANPAYLSALLAWLETPQESGDSNLDSDANASLAVFEPWVQSGVEGTRQLNKSAVYAFWLWILCLMASLVLLHSAWVMVPKLRQLYENSGLEIGFGFRCLDWIYTRLTPLALLSASVLIAAPILWRNLSGKITRHWKIPSYFSKGVFLGYLVLGGLIVAALGVLVFLPIAELLLELGEPRP
jgi:hypothetical protein